MKEVAFLFSVLSLLVLSPAAFANHHEEGEAEETALEGEMKHMNDAWKKVRRSVRNPSQFAAAAEQVAIMIEHSKKSIELEPILLAEQDGDAAKKKFLEGYKKGMEETVALLVDLKKALESGDEEAVAAAIGDINDARKKGHKAYQPEDED